MSESDAIKLINETEEIFNSFKMDAEVYPSNMDEAEQIKTENGCKDGTCGNKLNYWA